MRSGGPAQALVVEADATAANQMRQQLEAALNAAKQIGDDTLQKRGGGRVTPEGFTHGTSAQRKQWLTTGYQSGDPRACEGTFDGL